MRRTALLLALLIVVAGGATVSTAAPGCAGQSTKRTGLLGTWTTFEVPVFPIGPKEAMAHAVDPIDGGRWWVTNGVVLSRSTDGGCTWKHVFELPATPTADVPASRQTDRIRVLAVPSTPDAHQTVVALVEVNAVLADASGADSRGGPASGTLAFAGSETLRVLGPLAAPVGRPGPLVIAPSNDRVIYAVAGGVVNASEDGGQSWRVATPRDEPGAPDGTVHLDFPPETPLPVVTRLAVDPLEPQAVWARVDDRIYGSRDGGRNYESLIDAEGTATFPLLEVTRTPGSAPRVTVGDQSDYASPVRALRIADDGKAFRIRRATPADLGEITGSATSSASGPGRSGLIFTTADISGTDSQVFYYFSQVNQVRPVDEFRIGPLRDVQRTRIGSAQFVFRTTNTLVRYLPALRIPKPPPSPAALLPLPEFGTGDARVRQLSDESRVVGPAELRLGRGETREVPLRLELSPEPTPLDVFFVLDTSGSMGDVVKGLARDFQDVADKLKAAGIDAFFGLGDYQHTGGMRYRRLVDIQPPGDPLRDALESIRLGGGNEPAYTALHQISTGSGIPSPSRGQSVPRGSGASWRDGSLRVIVHATDEVPSEDPDGFTRGEATIAMQEDGTRHVGIEVVRTDARAITDSNLAPDGTLTKILKQLSQDTNALAPDGGIDCNGDGKIDIQVNQPLVCELKPLTNSKIDLAPALRDVLGSLVDLQSPGIAVGPAVATRALAATMAGPPGITTVDVKRANALDFTLQVTCAQALSGKSFPLQLRPAVGQRIGRASLMTVRCGTVPAPRISRPAEAVPLVPPAAAVLAVPVLPPLPVPPPAPAPAAAPAPAPAGAPVAVTAVQPGIAVGLAPEEEQIQLAFAEQRDVEEAGKLGQELAMVGLESQPDQLALRIAAMGLLCAAATGVALRQRPAVFARRAD
ncbi:MAG TPA: hypothetical protein VNA30_01975 [Mycobacteriales bacterium]|nr:hypothetical protein [Mycobacteriales bacterium]